MKHRKKHKHGVITSTQKKRIKAMRAFLDTLLKK